VSWGRLGRESTLQFAGTNPMKRSLSLGIAVACIFTGAISAHAADLPARTNPPAYNPPPPLTFSWTGPYFGINGGYAWGRSSWSDPVVGADSGKFGTTGGLVGGQLGYNWQTGVGVIGIETDGDWLNVKGSTAGPGGVCLTNGGGTCETQQNWVGTTRIRLGYALDRWMPYATGGIAYGNIEAVQPNGTANQSNVGWTAGAGVELALDRNWSARVEYLHIDLGNINFTGFASGTSTLAIPATNDLVRAGINYRF
jgi:outer membrane immunogenic protein